MIKDLFPRSEPETRIKLEDTPKDIILKMSDGNPGAITVMVKLLQQAGDIDRAAAFGGVQSLLNLDMLGLYGSSIWVLFKYQCDQNIEKTVAVLRAFQLGFLKATDVKAAADQNNIGKVQLDVDAALAQVKERLGDDWVSPKVGGVA